MVFTVAETMHFLFLSVACSVLVSVLLKLAPRRGIDIAQAVTWNYLAASVLSLLVLKPSLQSLQGGHTPWLALLGLAVAIIASLKYSVAFILIYLLWIGITRLILTLLLSVTGHRIGPAYPLILYYNQIVGALVKIYVFFRLDQQSWTRQNTTLKRDLASFSRWFNTWSSRAMTFSATSVFIATLLAVV